MIDANNEYSIVIRHHILTLLSSSFGIGGYRSLSLISAEENAQVAPFAHLPSVEFAISVLAVGRHLDPARLMVAVLAQASRVVLQVGVLAQSDSLLDLA